MAGIYIHIPFCHKACTYCNFHFSTNLTLVDKMVTALCRELELKKAYLDNSFIDTVYLGGGTPSILNTSQLAQLFQTIHSTFKVSDKAEITLEANPEDLSKENILFWKNVGVNRLSIGIQSFQDDTLKWMNRNHSRNDSIKGVRLAQDLGIENLSIDLIYGTPHLTEGLWRREIQTAIELQVAHISSYCLTIEDKTALAHQVKKGLSSPVSEEQSELQLLVLMEEMGLAGYEHYEISNFCKPFFESKHNSSYWQGLPYIGIGPGAHSYNLSSRQFNVSNNTQYIHDLSAGEIPFTEELLTPQDLYNEYILTRLRTKWGIHINELTRLNPTHLPKIQQLLSNFIENGFLDEINGLFRLTTKGKLLADEITLQLMV
ncbi:MAG: radical SAM family heme chaperone HemW [Cytophaga sp.]|uniref:radical SAM family heme chaperone HemW n=1 Tax=Cytophaga sp. TaxID=29535 RepID=UPI003F819344